MKISKTLPMILITGLFVLVSKTLMGQQSDNSTSLLIHNDVIKGKGPLKVKKFSNVDLSKYAVKKITPEKMDSIKAIAPAATGTGVVAFDCNNADATKPVLLKYLNQIDTRVFDVTKNTDVSLSLFGIGGSLSKKDILLEANFWAFKDYPCSGGKAVRAMVGMTMYLHISSTSIKMPSFTLENVCAAAQLGKASASYHLAFYGLTTAIDFANLPSVGDLTVDNYSKIIGAWDTIVRSLTTDTVVDPVIVYNIIPTVPSVN